MRSEIGKLVLDRTFEERDSLNSNIKLSLNTASQKWGIDCMRYEIKDIKPPEQIRRSMELQAESERIKRSKILQSEGEMLSKINIAEGIKREAILDGEGQAEKILQEANSLSQALGSISGQIRHKDGQESDALKLRLSEQYIEALSEILNESNVIMVPKGGDQSSMASPKVLAQAMTVYNQMSGGNAKQSSQLGQSLGGGSDEILRRIVADLTDLKSENSKKQNKAKESFKYLDDKSLYSTDG
jgi:regulator of protease activity HflC (stomatin/prohibitin superfamily)